jgi:hypothetical protein
MSADPVVYHVMRFKPTREAKEKANSDWWTWLLSILTVAALVGQGAILAAQAYFLRGTLKETAQAAEAAQRQGKILANMTLRH